jgi:hypothetical protein
LFICFEHPWSANPQFIQERNIPSCSNRSAYRKWIWC